MPRATSAYITFARAPLTYATAVSDSPVTIMEMNQTMQFTFTIAPDVVHFTDAQYCDMYIDRAKLVVEE